ncbi:MAG: hypothetical protein C0599_01670 [Salinivirgaceae bacterium]|nr:MAG: hypothetical protein C0599_01670 [Salinivirgaceae bacterium]
MKLILLLPLAFIATIAFSQSKIEPFVKTITQENLKKHIYTLASDSLEGRKTGEIGQKKAAKYISTFFQSHNLNDMGMKDYYQPFNLMAYSKNKVNVYFKNNGYNKKKKPIREFKYGHFFSQEMELHDTLEFKYIGYGYDLKTEDLSNKAVLLLLDENFGKTYENIKQIAHNTHAKVFIVLFPKLGIWRFNPEKDNINELNKMQPVAALTNEIYGLTFEEYHSKYQKKVEIISQFSKAEDAFYTIAASTYDARYLFNESIKDLIKLEKQVAKGKAKRNITLLTDSLICNIKVNNFKKENSPTENVLAYIEGTDKKEEAIVVTAHYDHIGKPREKACVGADDNASGTAAVMEMARTLQLAAEQGLKPKRSIIFAAVSGEEEGLRGSDFFVRHSPVPIENIALNVNLDMIGRNNGNKEKYNQTMYLLTKGKNKRKYSKIAKRFDKANPDLKISKHPGLMKKLLWSFSSDHYRFRRRNIPVAVVFTGLHPDYHTPRDTPDKINYPKATEITKLTCQTIWEIANIDKNILEKDIEHPTKQNFIDRIMD